MLTRRDLIRGSATLCSGTLLPGAFAEALDLVPPASLEEVGYDAVEVTGALETAQRENVTAVLLGLSPDSLLQPFRRMAGQPASGTSLGGWYEYLPDYNYHHAEAGLAPGATFGQWTSALARLYAGSRAGGRAGAGALAERATELNAMLRQEISPGYFQATRFAGYSLDKLNCGLLDAHRLLGDETAFDTLGRVTDCAEPVLPGHAVDREVQWKVGADTSWMWDETYTLPENLYLLSAGGAGARYRRIAEAYLDDATFFDPLAAGKNVLGDRHAYSYVNALSSAMQAYFVGGSATHLRAAINGFDLLQRQSFATGGWGPDELLRAPGYDELARTLSASHNGFETPCGSYAHLKLTRSLLRVTRDGRYGDSAERVLYNTVQGALPLQPDGRSFYNADYNWIGRRVYSAHRWPCCSGTLPQVVADYGINAYLREPGAVWVNLYLPSTLRWNEGSAAIRVDQTGTYPEDDRVRLQITTSRPARFTVRLRIPGWANGFTVSVNGQTRTPAAERGFIALNQLWHTGDRVELQLPMALRPEALPSNGGPAHPELIALLYGPLVLFPLRQPGETGSLHVRPDALARAERVSPRAWRVQTAAGDRIFVPFTAVGDQPYSTYTTLS